MMGAKDDVGVERDSVSSVTRHVAYQNKCLKAI